MTPEHGSMLLEIARSAIAQSFGGPKVGRPAGEDWLDEPAALFVTLHRDGELRGCIGSVDARRPIFDEVVDKTRAAAFHDTRMAPVQADELPDLDIEISVLGPLEPIGARSQEELLRNLKPGDDGLVLQSMDGSALFLPSVWKQLPNPRAFVQALMSKARLRRWPADMQAYRFSAEVISASAVKA